MDQCEAAFKGATTINITATHRESGSGRLNFICGHKQNKHNNIKLSNTDIVIDYPPEVSISVRQQMNQTTSILQRNNIRH